MKSRSLFPSLIFVALFIFGAAEFRAQAEGPIHVLLAGQYIANNYDPGWPKFQAACLKQGVDIEVLTRDNDYPFYTSDVLKKFDVVIFCGLPDHTSDAGCSEAEVAAFRDRLDSYYRAGGGVLWAPLGFGGWPARWTGAVGNRYDVATLDEALSDPSKTVDVNPAFNNALFRFIWTTNIAADHPVTEGVRGLLMPIR